MTVDFSSPADAHRARRLPRDFATIVVVIDAAMLLLNIAMILLPDTPQVASVRSSYALPVVWVGIVASMAMGLLMAGTLAWCHGRQLLETRGVAGAALLSKPRLRFGLVHLAVLALNVYALSPLLYEVQLMFMPGGRLNGYVGLNFRAVLAIAMFVQALVQLAVLVLGLWLAAWAATRGAPAAARPVASGTFDTAAPLAPAPRRAIALVVGAMCAAMQLWAAMVASRWAELSRDLGVGALLLSWFVPPLLAFVLAYGGAWLGAAPVASRMRPFRALGAAVSAFVLVQVACLLVAVAWLVLAYNMGGLAGASGAIGFIGAFALLYLVLLVVLTRVFVRVLYRRYL